jgi:site-specific recombinase XerD
MQPEAPRLLDLVRHAVRRKHASIRTEESSVGWIKRCIVFHNKRHPNELGVAEVEAYLTYLAVEGQVAASTQNQALAALLFLYIHVLNQPLEGVLDAVRALQPQRLPTVLNRDEVRRLLEALHGVYRLHA